jgi:hypothetical protein
MRVLESPWTYVLGAVGLSAIMGVLGANLGAGLALGTFDHPVWRRNEDAFGLIPALVGTLAAAPWILVHAVLVFRDVPHRPLLHVLGSASCSLLATATLALIFVPLMAEPWR